jgi:glycosyltransferase involved in cell wall biosynthesis
MGIRKKLKTANRIFKEEGWTGVKNRIRLRLGERRDKKSYQKWILKHQITETRRKAIKNEIGALKVKPLFSVILPVYDVEEKWLRKCLESVLRQLYTHWELCVADDNSPSPHIRKVLEEYAAKDQRIKVVFRETNGHISAASNSALELATGEFCALLDHDDELSEDAFFYLAKEINDFPETAMIYSDEDMLDEQGVRSGPKFKPDFSRDLFYSLNLVTHLSVYRTDILRLIKGFRIGLEGSQDYDLALRFIEQAGEKRIRHIPRILYHWRAIRGSVAFSPDEKPYAHERAREALRDHFERTGKNAAIERGIYQLHRARYRLPEDLPRVSLILSADKNFEAEKLAADFLAATDYQNLEIILICPENGHHRTDSAQVKVNPSAGLTKAESLNRAARQSSGAILCFIDAALRPLSKDWLKELASFVIQEEIGAAGGRILDKNETIAGSGIIFGFDKLARTAFQGLPHETNKNLCRAQAIGNFSAVSAECLAVRRTVFDEFGGFDAENLPNSLFDADLCLRLGEKGLRIVLTPYAEMIEIEKMAPPVRSARETDFFRQKWRNLLEKDPFYNPNLSLAGETFTIEI